MSENVQSVDRTFKIIEMLSKYPQGISISELSKVLELHKSTVHRLLQTLVNLGYVNKKSDSDYFLSYKLFEIGSSIIDEYDLRQVARPYLSELRDLTNEVVHLVIQDGPDIIYIDKYENNATIRMHSNIGKRMPMYCCSVGKAILSTYSVDAVKHIWSISNIEQITEKTITNLDDLFKDLQLIKERQYSIDDEENELGIKCYGAPILGYNGKAVGAISISIPLIRLSEKYEKQFPIWIKKYSSIISKAIGYNK
ncbi:IclR family transcriptional regulator [Clostridium sp. DL1XJH146]